MAIYRNKMAQDECRLPHELSAKRRKPRLQAAPQVIDNEYLVLGTAEKEAWREGVRQPKTTEEMLAHTHDFKEYYSELRMTQAGWYPEGVTPQVAQPPIARVGKAPNRRR